MCTVMKIRVVYNKSISHNTKLQCALKNMALNGFLSDLGVICLFVCCCSLRRMSMNAPFSTNRIDPMDIILILED